MNFRFKNSVSNLYVVECIPETDTITLSKDASKAYICADGDAELYKRKAELMIGFQLEMELC